MLPSAPRALNTLKRGIGGGRRVFEELQICDLQARSVLFFMCKMPLSTSTTFTRLFLAAAGIVVCSVPPRTVGSVISARSPYCVVAETKLPGAVHASHA